MPDPRLTTAPPAPSGIAESLLSGGMGVDNEETVNEKVAAVASVSTKDGEKTVEDPRLAQAKAARSREKETRLSQAAVSAESAMNSIAMRMANKLMGQVEKIEGTSKNPSNSDLISSMRSTVSFGSTTRPMATSMSSTGSTERFTASPIKRSHAGLTEGDDPYGDKQYSENTRDRQARWERLNESRGLSALPSITAKPKKKKKKSQSKDEPSNHPTRDSSRSPGRGGRSRSSVSIGGARSQSQSRSPSRSQSRSPSRSMSPSRSGGSKSKKRRRGRKGKVKKGDSVYRHLFDRWFWANEFVLRNDTLLNAMGLVLKVLETTFQIDSAELAELLLDKTEVLVEERNRLRRELEAERKRIFLVKQKLLKAQTDLENEQKLTAQLTKALEDSEKYRKETAAQNKILTERNKVLEEELPRTIKQRDKQKRKVRHREKALSKLESQLATARGEIEILKRQKGREHEMVRKMANKYATMEAKVIRVEKEKQLLTEHFEGEIRGLTKSATMAASQSRMLLDSANSSIADYRVQIHDWQEKELSHKPDTVAAAVRKIGIHAAKFLMHIEKEAADEDNETRGGGGSGSPPKPIELRRRWKALRFQVQEMREMAYGMLSGATLAQQQRSEREIDLEKEITKWKLKAKASEAEVGRERVLTKMLRRIFDPTSSKMRATLHVSGTKREKVYNELDKNKKWDVKTGTTFTMTCCKHCGKFFIEEDSEWPFPCEFGEEHETLEEIVDVTGL